MTRKSRKSKHIDKSVVYLFGVLSLLAILTLSYKKANYYSCDEVYFSIENENLNEPIRVGSVVNFKDFTSDSKRWEWDFGDDSDVDERQEVRHQYEEAGIYVVKLRVNNQCIIEERITVLDSIVYTPYEEPEPIEVGQPWFSFPRYVYLGHTGYGRAHVPGADRWQWSVDGSPLTNVNDSIMRYTFEELGQKQIKLVVNGDDQNALYMAVTVIPEPEEVVIDTPIYIAPPVVVTADTTTVVEDDPVEYVNLYISKAELTKQIYSLATKTKTLDAFLTNMCGDGSAMVQVNGKQITMKAFYEKIKGQNIKVKEVSPVRDIETKCITTFTIKYKLKFSML